MKLTVQRFLTLDGVMQAPGGPEEESSDSFTHGGWQAPFPDPAVGEFARAHGPPARFCSVAERSKSSAATGLIRTDPATPIATASTPLPKYVVSSSLSADRGHLARRAPDTLARERRRRAAVEAHEGRTGDELQIWGSSKLSTTLVAATSSLTAPH